MKNIIHITIRVGLGVLASVILWLVTQRMNLFAPQNTFQLIGASMIFWAVLTNTGPTVDSSVMQSTVIPENSSRTFMSHRSQRVRRTIQEASPTATIIAGILMFVIAWLVGNYF